MKHTLAHNQQGVTIVEVLVALAVAAIMVSSLSEVVTGYVHVAQRGRYLNLANVYTEAKVEAIRNNGFNSINIGTTNLKSELPLELPPSRDGTMTISVPTAGIKQIDITVTYNDQGKVASQSYTTYIGELGVGQ